MEYVSRVDKLTPEQEARMASYAQEWIEKGLQTGETDWETFDRYMPIAYAKAGIKYPANVVRVQSPLVGALVAAVAEGIWKKKRGAVGDAVGGAVGDAVGDAVRDAVGDAVDGAVGDAVQTAINIARNAGASLSWHSWLGGQFWVGYWWWYGVASIGFLFDICKLKLAQDIMERAEAYRKVCESVNYIWPNSNFIIVCARPSQINRNLQGQLHNDRGMSIKYPDGWGLYHLNGVRFDEELFKKVTSGKMPFQDIIAIRDTDQRTQAMKYGDVWDFVKHAKGERLDEVTKLRQDGTPVRYWLYKFPKGDIFTQDAYYAIYDDLVPESDKQYMSGVVPCKSVAEAMAWKQSSDEYTVTPEYWKTMIPGVHMA